MFGTEMAKYRIESLHREAEAERLARTLRRSRSEATGARAPRRPWTLGLLRPARQLGARP